MRPWRRQGICELCRGLCPSLRGHRLGLLPAIRRSVQLVAGFVTVVAAVVLVSSAGAAPYQVSEPTARVGAYYFDGWAGPLSSYHFNGLFQLPFSSWRPLYGWRDAAPMTLDRQLEWANEFGIDFFLFDWYHLADDGGGDTNSAIKNYVRLKRHHGVSFALTYINNEERLVIPCSEWPAVAEEWVTQYFTNPDYARVAGEPLFEVHDVVGMTQQFGGTDGVNWALDTLRQVAREHGLPGVFIVGGVYVDSLFDWYGFPRGVGGEPEGLLNQHYDALSNYGYPALPGYLDGEQPYSKLVVASNEMWDLFAAKSPIPYIADVTAGWDGRPNREAPLGHLWWYDRTPNEVGTSLHDAVEWATSNPTMQVEAPPAKPLVLIEAWNELQEGSFIVPTIGAGYAYGLAVAAALGITWPSTHARSITLSLRGRLGFGSVDVSDGWADCRLARITIWRRAGRAWHRFASVQTALNGGFTFGLAPRHALYRASVGRVTAYGQTCGEANTTATPR
jgi:Glycosyltransferase WbsX